MRIPSATRAYSATPLSVVSSEVSATTRSTGDDLPETTLISYTYDKAGRKATMTEPFGTVLWFAQDLLLWPVRKA